MAETREHIQKKLTKLIGLAQDSGENEIIIVLLRAKLEIARIAK